MEEKFIAAWAAARERPWPWASGCAPLPRRTL